MNVFDLHHNCDMRIALANQAIDANGTTVGAIIDTAGFEALEFGFQMGTITDGAYAISLFESDASDMAGETAVSAEETLGNADFALADDDTAKRIGYIGKKRYVRVKIVATAVTDGVDAVSGLAIPAFAHHEPVAD